MKTTHTLLKDCGRLGALGLLGGLLLAAGCASQDKKVTDDKAKKTKEEYVYYYPTGSNIPMKVRKEDLQATDAESEADQLGLRRAIEKGTKQDKDPAGH